MASVLERFEAVGELYRRRFGYLRPGKDESPMVYRGQNADRENVERFSEWIRTLAFDDAIDRIVALEARLEELQQDDSPVAPEV